MSCACISEATTKIAIEISNFAGGSQIISILRLIEICCVSVEPGIYRHEWVLCSSHFFRVSDVLKTLWICLAVEVLGACFVITVIVLLFCKNAEQFRNTITRPRKKSHINDFTEARVELKFWVEYIAGGEPV